MTEAYTRKTNETNLSEGRTSSAHRSKDSTERRIRRTRVGSFEIGKDRNWARTPEAFSILRISALARSQPTLPLRPGAGRREMSRSDRRAEGPTRSIQTADRPTLLPAPRNRPLSLVSRPRHRTRL